MEQLTRIEGVAAAIWRINIDTDQISPFSTHFKGERTAFGAALFGNWRYLEDGSENPDFILNQEPFRHASILIAERNFGAGSSRESAHVSLRAFGFRVVIAPSFGGVFVNNAVRAGILPVEQPIEVCRELAEAVNVTVDLTSEMVLAGNRSWPFRTAPLLRQMMLAGLDEVEFTLARRGTLEAFWAKDEAARPWIYDV
jgi:3-isopropylmalate/(R)-2-methylmalate dehydratase small subunit